ncbi:MAG: diaminopimelate epimerase [Sumerlaeia bacterium]
MISMISKYDAAGNDFVAWDARGIEWNSTAISKTMIALCDRRRGIGADGVIVLKEPLHPELGTDFRMVYFNADGSLGDMCGNGARSIVRFALDSGVIHQPRTRFETGAGIYSAEVVEGGNIKLGFPDIQGLPTAVNFDGEETLWDATFQVVGVPHAVVLLDSVEDFEVDQIGRRLRRHRATGPKGANINFVSFQGANKIKIRTFECGVEAETLACGTGCVATAISRAVREGLSGENTFYLQTAGGDEMIIRFNLADDAITSVSLTGPAVRVFEAKLLQPLSVHD